MSQILLEGTLPHLTNQNNTLDCTDPRIWPCTFHLGIKGLKHNKNRIEQMICYLYCEIQPLVVELAGDLSCLRKLALIPEIISHFPQSAVVFWK